jgi:hypothetical protein
MLGALCSAARMVQGAQSQWSTKALLAPPKDHERASHGGQLKSVGCTLLSQLQACMLHCDMPQGVQGPVPRGTCNGMGQHWVSWSWMP